MWGILCFSLLVVIVRGERKFGGSRKPLREIYMSVRETGEKVREICEKVREICMSVREICGRVRETCEVRKFYWRVQNYRTDT